ncbi:MAG TPA: hypothetical protein VGM27_09145 [Acidobacteriaceae bacterium]
MRRPRISVAQIGQQAIDWYSNHNRKDLTTFTGRVNAIIAALGSRDAEGLKPSEIDAWLSAHSEWSPATGNRYKTVLSKAYQLAVKNGDVSTNPARLVDHRPENNRRSSACPHFEHCGHDVLNRSFETLLRREIR